jgi:anti-sigma B factor antagonist
MPNISGGPQLTLETELIGDKAIIRCRGRLVIGTGGILHAEVTRVLPDVKKIVLDLTDLTFMDSIGVGTLMRVYVSTKAAGCELELINVGKRIMELLGITHLLSILTVIGENDLRMS